MRYFFFSILLFLSSLTLKAQFPYSDDTLQMIFDKSGFVAEVELDEEMYDEMKIMSAWLLNKQDYILSDIQKRLKEGTMNQNVFSPMVFILEYDFDFPKEKIEHILAIKKAIQEKYGNNKEVDRLLILYDFHYYNIYGDDKQILATIDKALKYYEEGKMEFLYIDMLYNKKLSILNNLGEQERYNATINEMHTKYPKQTYVVYSNQLYFNKEYRKVIDVLLSESNVTFTPLNTFQIALSYYHLNNRDSAKLYFDEFMVFISSQDEDLYNTGYVAVEDFVSSEDESEIITYQLDSERLMDMFDFYISINDTSKLCILQPFIENNFSMASQRKSDREKLPYKFLLSDEKYEYYKEEAAKNQKIFDENRASFESRKIACD